MDIGAMSMVMNQTSIQSAVSVSVMKMAMNSEAETAVKMTTMMSNMAMDTSKGTIIDTRV